MNKQLRIHFFLIVAAILLAPSAVFAGTTTDFDNSILVELDDGAAINLNRQHKQITIGDEQFVQIPVASEEEAEETIDAFEHAPGVVTAERTVRRRMALLSDDPFLSTQWHLLDSFGVGATAAWESQTGSSDVVVAVIDSGVDLDHPDLYSNIWQNDAELADYPNGIDDDGNGYVDDLYGYDFVNGGNNPNPEPNGEDDDLDGEADGGVIHGTHVAGIIAAQGNNGVGISGVAWDASIMALQVLDDEGSGTDADIAEAIEYAVDNGAHIINMSLGGIGSTNVLQTAVEYAVDNGVLIVAAVGNEAINIDNNPFFPACYDNVLAVAAIDEDGDGASFSNFGKNCVDVAAPGEFIYSTYVTDEAEHGFSDDYGYLHGTSMATPIVAGVAALLKSEDSSLTRAQLLQAIVDTSEDIDLPVKYGDGLVDADSAIANYLTAATAPSPPTSISIYKGAQKGKSITEATRTDDNDPYFEWTGATDNDGTITGYYVYFGTSETADPEESGTLQDENTYHASEVTGNETTYYLRVKSVDNDDVVSGDVTTVEYLVDTKVKKVRKVKAKRTKKGVRITWNKLKGEHVTKYRVFRKRAGKKKKFYKRIRSVNRAKTKIVDKKVKEGRTYDYVVKAVDDNGFVSKYSIKARKKVK